jgi:hypothetical protein
MQEVPKIGAVSQRFCPVRLLIPVHREIAIDYTYPIVNSFTCPGKIATANIFVDGTASAQLSEFFDTQASKS